MTLEEVKNYYTMAEIVERYGFRPNRAGAIHCPFHQGDKGASMKIYKKDYHCFGCGAHGDQIDFVARMDGLSFREAFISLGGTYDDHDREEVREKIKRAEQARAEKKRREEHLRRNIRIVSNYITALRNGIEYFQPLSDEWCFCQNELPYQLYLYDVLAAKMGRR